MSRESFAYPLSPAQQRLWRLRNRTPRDTLYNVIERVRFSGKMDVHAFAQSVVEIVRRHDALRTTFHDDHRRVLQVVHPSLAPAWVFEDVSSLEPRRRAEVLAQRAANEASISFDLAVGPLARFRLIRLALDEHVLFVTTHYLIADGWSTCVLFRELASFYGAFVEDRPPLVAPLPVQYADFIHWQRELASSARIQRLRSEWRGELEGWSPFALATDRPRDPARPFELHHATAPVPETVVRQLEALGREEGATLFMVLLAAVKLSLSLSTGKHDIGVGTWVAYRRLREFEPLIGLFANQLILRTNLAGAGHFRALLRRVRETTLRAMGLQDLPYEMLLEEIAPERMLDDAPLHGVVFNMPSFVQEAPRFSGLAVERYGLQVHTAVGVDLTLYALRLPEGLCLGAAYDAGVFEAERIRDLLARLASLLDRVAASPDEVQS